MLVIDTITMESWIMSNSERAKVLFERNSTRARKVFDTYIEAEPWAIRQTKNVPTVL